MLGYILSCNFFVLLFVSFSNGVALGGIVNSFAAHSSTNKVMQEDETLAVGMAIIGDDELIVSTYGLNSRDTFIEDNLLEVMVPVFNHIQASSKAFNSITADAFETSKCSFCNHVE